MSLCVKQAKTNSSLKALFCRHINGMGVLFSTPNHVCSLVVLYKWIVQILLVFGEVFLNASLTMIVFLGWNDPLARIMIVCSTLSAAPPSEDQLSDASDRQGQEALSESPKSRRRRGNVVWIRRHTSEMVGNPRVSDSLYDVCLEERQENIDL